MNIWIETIIRRLSVKPVKSVYLNSQSELEVIFLNGYVIKQKFDVYFGMFMCIMNDLKSIEKIPDNSVDPEDERMFVSDPVSRYLVFGLQRGDMFRSVNKSGEEFFTRLS